MPPAPPAPQQPERPVAEAEAAEAAVPVEVQAASAEVPAHASVRQELLPQSTENVEADGHGGVDGSVSEVLEHPAATEGNEVVDAREGRGDGPDAADEDVLAREDEEERARGEDGAAEGRVAEWDQGADGQDGVDGGLAEGLVAGGMRDEEVPLEEFLGLRGPVRHMVSTGARRGGGGRGGGRGDVTCGVWGCGRWRTR